MSGTPMRELAKLATTLARPEMERRTVWHLLAGWKHWALILIRHAPKSAPPEKPSLAPTVRINPEFLRKIGIGLKPESLIHERIHQHLRAIAQDAHEIEVNEAAAGAADAAIAVLAELGVNVADLRNPEETKTDV
ncbi:hypothetical protein [Microbispora sp. GKU 823]|uniref:hypothetical protein n=1 Tax=Microbispora sp. GKU 823 TaxID=1652100 RepID=UPI0009A3561D|nr:hypothetical protein [Microbispora sp. GKU 823]OPG13684.1 hypothetical protein B1L11_06770 [Microbispora sp. GKU 823]